MRKDMVLLVGLFLALAACSETTVGSAFPIDAAVERRGSSDGRGIAMAEVGGNIAPADASVPDSAQADDLAWDVPGRPAAESADALAAGALDAASASLADGPAQDSLPIPTKDYFALSFSDLSTNLRPYDLFLWYDLYGGAALFPYPPGDAREVLEVYAKQISLYTWPEREAVPFTTEVYVPETDASTPMDSEDHTGGLWKIYVRFTPDAKPRWYMVEVTDSGKFEMVKNVGGGYMPSQQAGDGGTTNVVAARFMTASYPLLYDAIEYKYKDGSRVLALSFSETVEITPIRSLVHLVGPAATVCTMWIPEPVAEQAPKQGVIYYDCTASVIRGLSLVVDTPLILNGPNFTIPADGPFYQVYGNDLIYHFGLPATP
jgi:hypothetical protein